MFIKSIYENNLLFSFHGNCYDLFVKEESKGTQGILYLSFLRIAFIVIVNEFLFIIYFFYFFILCS